MKRNKNNSKIFNTKNNTAHGIFATLFNKSKTALKFVCLFVLLTLISLTTYALSCTQASSQMKVLSAYAMSPTYYMTNNAPPENFETFAGNSICYNVYSDSQVFAECLDAVDIIVYKNHPNTPRIYTVKINTSTPMESLVTITNAGGANISLHFTVLDPASDLETLELRPTQNVFSTTGFNVVNFCANGNPNLLYYGNVELSFTNGDWSITFTKESDYTCVFRLNCGYLSLYFANVTDVTKYNGATMRVTMGNVSAELVIEVEDWETADSCIFIDKDPTYYLTEDCVTVSALIPEESFCSFTLLSSDFASIVAIERVGTVGAYAKYDILIDFIRANYANDIIICANVKNGIIEHSVSIARTTVITNIEITANKKSFKADETIIVTAVLNGSQEVTAVVDWYINDELVATAPQLEYVTSSGKNINVYAKSGEVVSNTLALNVAYSTSEMIIWYIVFALAVLIMIGLIVFKSKRKTFISSASLVDRARKFTPRYKTYITKYKRHQFFDLVYDIANLREDVLINFAETKDLCFDKANRDLTSAHKIVRMVYKAPKTEKQALLEQNLAQFETAMNDAIASLQEFVNKNPTETFFNFKRYKRKPINNKTDLK